MKPRRWLPDRERPYVLLRLAWLLTLTLLIVIVMYAWYDTVIWSSVSDRPFTQTMREHPWILPAIGLPLLAALVVRISFTWHGRVLMVWIAAALGFIAGHVYW